MSAAEARLETPAAEPAAASLRGGRRNYARYLALAAVVVWAAYQTFFRITKGALQVDEPVYFGAGWQYVHGNFSANREHPPTAKYLMGLAELLHGSPSLGAARLTVAAISFLGGLITFWWIRREVGFWPGLFAAASWWLLPRYIGTQPPRIDGLALLDPIMLPFAVAGLASAWQWFRSGRWQWAVVSGLLFAAAVTSKVDGTVILVALLVLLVKNGLGRRRTLLGAAAFLVSFAVAFVALYAPMGLRSAIRYMLQFQSHHNAVGHRTIVAGHTYQFGPWWSTLWFEQQGVGTLTVIVLVVGIVLALTVRPDRLVAFLGVALLALIVFFAFSGVQLPSYYFPYMWFEGVLAAIGYWRAAHYLRPKLLVASVSVVAGVLLAVSAIGVSRDVANMQPAGLTRVKPYLRAHSSPEHVLFIAVPGYWNLFVSDRRGTSDPTRGPFDAVVIGPTPATPAARDLAGFLAAHRSAFTRADLRGVIVWIPHRGAIAEKNGTFTLLG